jgi:hypothetical protein
VRQGRDDAPRARPLETAVRRVAVVRGHDLVERAADCEQHDQADHDPIDISMRKNDWCGIFSQKVPR